MSHYVRLTYRGEPRLASALVSMLKSEGLTVSWQPPVERRSFGQAAIDVVEMTVSGLAVAGITAATTAALAKFKQRFPGAADIDTDESGPPTDE